MNAKMRNSAAIAAIELMKRLTKEHDPDTIAALAQAIEILSVVARAL